MFATIGLVLDIAGAIWITKGFLALSEKKIAELADTTPPPSGKWGPRPALVEHFRKVKRDTLIGLVLLGLGFLLQLVAVWT